MLAMVGLKSILSILLCSVRVVFGRMLLKRGMGNGEWGMGNGELKWEIENEKLIIFYINFL